jgi:glutamate-1-semialdehyde 2,1-aminomutase
MSAVHGLIPGGAHTYAKGDDQYPAGMAPVIERGAGCRVWDLDGDEYVEFGGGRRSVTLGHGFEPVMDAVRCSLAAGSIFARPHRIEREIARWPHLLRTPSPAMPQPTASIPPWLHTGCAIAKR